MIRCEKDKSNNNCKTTTTARLSTTIAMEVREGNDDERKVIVMPVIGWF
jgi:hypothetical protein